MLYEVITYGYFRRGDEQRRKQHHELPAREATGRAARRCAHQPAFLRGSPAKRCVITSYSIHYTKLYDVYEEVDGDLRSRVEDVIFNRREDATERLIEFANTVKAGGKQSVRDDAWRRGSVEERLTHA